MNIGKNIHIIRAQKGLTQKEFAEKLGFIQELVKIYEADDSDPSVSTLIKIAEVLEVPVMELLSESKKKDIEEMAVEEILRQQLELLAKTSKRCAEAFDEKTDMLPGLTEAMLSVTKELQGKVPSNYLPLSSRVHTAL